MTRVYNRDCLGMGTTRRGKAKGNGEEGESRIGVFYTHV
jgi:hypothetical protein